MNLSEILADICEVSYFHSRGGTGPAALNGVSMEIRRGEFLALVGGNGSGKSTLAGILNGLLLPCSGEVRVNGIDTRDRENIWKVRSAVGLVFQNPDNQIIGTTVEEDVAFGPENLGLSPETVRRRVGDALDSVGMAGYAKRATHLLSGGERQKLALAGVLAMEPQMIILDEATSMLDPQARKTVMDILRGLHREKGTTVLLITGRMEEAAGAERVAVMEAGRIVLEGTPEEVFSHAALIGELGLELPPVAELFQLLNADGFDFPAGISGMDEAVLALMDACTSGAHNAH